MNYKELASTEAFFFREKNKGYNDHPLKGNTMNRRQIVKLQLAIAEQDFYSDLLDFTYSTLTETSSDEEFDRYGKIMEKYNQAELEVKRLKRKYTKPNRRKTFIPSIK